MEEIIQETIRDLALIAIGIVVSCRGLKTMPDKVYRILVFLIDMVCIILGIAVSHWIEKLLLFILWLNSNPNPNKPEYQTLT
ncbi:hypothetical protein [Nostoc sp. CALU 1950]|uniref:hypothetical protein n=1 Tax=Nostoc sp. CALU 1950 TaxID=3104321 RepID=UPI003EB72FB3